MISKMELSTATSNATAPEANGHHHDTHAVPPAFIQKAHWHYSSVKKAVLDLDEDVIDFRRGLTAHQKDVLKPVNTLPASAIEAACMAYKKAYLGSTEEIQDIEDVTVYEHIEFPGKRWKSSTWTWG
jgi:alkylated DNA repair protein alkB family protein 1